MTTSLARQAERLQELFAEMIRGYQFRDREGICCHGLTVSQCYALDMLGRRGPLAMGELAAELYLETSSMTRVVDQLVRQRLVTREADAGDRRVCRIRMTPKGRSLVARVRAELITEHEMVLRNIPTQSREAVILAMSELLSAFKKRQCKLPAEVCGAERARK